MKVNKMRIKCDYKVTGINQDTKHMFVEFSLPGHSSISMLIPIPTVDISLEDYLIQFLPTSQWGVQKKLSKEYLNITEKETGVLFFDDSLLVPPDMTKIMQMNQDFSDYQTTELENNITKILLKLENATI